MCGFAGFLEFSRVMNADALTANVLGMADMLHLRGPDDRGAWVDAEAGLALGFRRLAIVDLTPEGHQPMVSAGGRYVLAFNGEVYNHAELRRELQAAGTPSFRGRSDTEVMLAAFEYWGPVRALERFVGMFAFALWDRCERTLRLARDRIGEKPLYFGRSGGGFVFGSELKALRAFPGFRSEVDREALALYMRFGYIPAPYSIYRGIQKLQPGTSLTITETGVISDPVPYWSARCIAEAGAASPFQGTDEEAVDRLEERLREAVGLQMVADVPLGAFLSGGVDSSTIVALMQVQSSRPVKTFTIGFEEAGYDEARYAKAVARHLGTEHTELYVRSTEAREVIPSLPTIYDEPLADSAAIPTYLVSQLARRHVTVSLSGDGGDELFGGYDWYRRTASVWGKVRRLPRSLRGSTSKILAGLVTSTDHTPRFAVGAGRFNRLASSEQLHKLAALLKRSTEPEDVHWSLLSNWEGRSSVVLGAAESVPTPPGWKACPGLGNVSGRLMLTDLLTYLPDDILAKVDRASMGVSLEARAPYLDHRVVELAFRLPTALKLRDGRGKWLLRQVLDRHVPRSLIERPKMGFNVPIGAWLRGPLRDWAEGLLEEGRLCQEGFLNPLPIRRKWAEHLSGVRDRGDHLWHVLMFQAWLAA
ncbi:asparagine synthase (glutamine-hydrolyzing) [Singulisphaera acidiphila]|uniref:asparagine synthase (glutamine-hydrolyzing) n=1 Tax=Singulisphaera acidiphila (strain ATCC BAA-1392 / DSM 18658 / VKM B-2454 / MOB10) TaxID=886293 RepID=L0DD47_SINAD|nr:asparagine synthase (glutamine-hydrolyzing) [Singulisphaera acidiphila]AGA26785.1 asparagine synthase, glutamine-hydrolyzing [Singulisphaera acidiphila DSM 18658]